MKAANIRWQAHEQFSLHMFGLHTWADF